MKEIGPIVGIDHKNTTKMTIEEKIIALFGTMEIGENIKIIIGTNIGIKISMIVIDPMIQIILMEEIGHMTETDHTIGRGHIVETRTTPENTKETGQALEIDHMTEMILIVEIDCKAITENLKTRDMREGLKTIIKTDMARIIIESDKNKNKYQNKDWYKNNSYGKASRSKERDYLYNEDDIFHSEIERVYKILQTMSQEKEMAIGFMVAFSENSDKILDSICSRADVDHLIAERIEYGRNQKDTHLKTKDLMSISVIQVHKIMNL